MLEDLRNRLTVKFDAEDRKAREQDEAALRKKTAEEQNAEDFERIKASVIRPAFQELEQIYKARGRYARFEEKESMIRLELAPYSYQRTMNPEFKLSFDKVRRTLHIYQATDGVAGPGNQIGLDDITQDWIYSEFLHYADPQPRHTAFGNSR